MTDKPIIFSGPMVRAILEGRKTQTRRVLKPKPGTVLADYTIDAGQVGTAKTLELPVEKLAVPYAPGDRLWVRETCSAVESHDGLDCVRYEADQVWRPIANTPEAGDRWCALFAYRNGRGLSVPSIHMPRWASRLTLIVEDVRLQRLQDISYSETLSEGIEATDIWKRREAACIERNDECGSVCRDSFRELWDNLNAKRGYGWEANPWVAVITFRPIQKNVDALVSEAAE